VGKSWPDLQSFSPTSKLVVLKRQQQHERGSFDFVKRVLDIMSGPNAPLCLRNGKDLSWLKISAEKQQTKYLPPWASCLDSSLISASETL